MNVYELIALMQDEIEKDSRVGEYTVTFDTQDTGCLDVSHWQAYHRVEEFELS